MYFIYNMSTPAMLAHGNHAAPWQPATYFPFRSILRVVEEYLGAVKEAANIKEEDKRKEKEEEAESTCRN